MKHIPPFALMDEWTPSQVLAVYDFCHLLTETLWQRYENILLEEMIAIDRGNGLYHHLEPLDEEHLERPFDDDIPF